MTKKRTYYPKYVTTVSSQPIRAPNHQKLELLTHLREAARSRAHARQQLRREASKSIEAIDITTDSSRNGGVAPSADTLSSSPHSVGT
ncbi:uncharacterized protein N7487_010336 [Penicillium crustosum]|uniref:uncharacterized protein n=1 Tax=Penicillium crustosum TaxID=36656 RepID=UPI0023983FDB|nr:uncharacterized protein N7487_010336 [Penicillium crustosum]KAJ5396033.1 hypothetical protein N7487_010336 [Penicillium crustosum]